MATCEIRGEFKPGFDTVLTPQALEFVARLTARFGSKVDELLATRAQRQAGVDGGQLPAVAESSREIRELNWIISDIPEDLLDRRVELLTPARPQEVRDALHSKVSVCIADLEDTLSPTWDNVIQGHRVLQGAATGALLDGGTAAQADVTLGMRPRGWHMEEKHLYVDGRPVPASLADFGLYLFHCAEALTARGSGPYISLPKLEGHQEARLWASVFEFAENELGLRQYCIRATAFIETVPAIFEIDEILYVLKDYLVGLECGPADYVFSFIKTLHAHADYVLPDQLNFDRNAQFLQCYSRLAVHTAHQRGILAIGGTAASLPEGALDTAQDSDFLAGIRAQKQREFEMGFDGTWVAQPTMVPLISEILADLMPGPNQLSVTGGGEAITAESLLSAPQGPVTEPGVRRNIRFALRYLTAWLGGEGCIFFNNRREDMATAESARAQLWQWVHHDVTLETGESMDEACFRRLLAEELPAAAGDLAALGVDSERLALAAELISDVVLRKDFVPFLSVHAYEHLP